MYRSTLGTNITVIVANRPEIQLGRKRGRSTPLIPQIHSTVEYLSENGLN